MQPNFVVIVIFLALACILVTGGNGRGNGHGGYGGYGGYGSNSCSASSSCTGGKICLNSNCKSCGSSYDCYSAVPQTPYCLRQHSGNLCKQCLTNNHCTSVSNSKCSNNVCSPCSGNGDCSHLPGGLKKCLSGKCVQCTANSDCGANICDTTSHTCRGPSCSSAACTQPTLPFCDGSYCRSCIVDQTVCTSVSKICASDGSCKACFNNQQCTNAATSRCDTSSTFTCTICSTNSDCSQIPNKNVCSTYLGCVECVNAQDCSPGSACQNNVCIASTVPLTVKVSATSSADTYTIDFPSQLVTNTDTIQGVAITLDGVDPSIYTYSLTMLSPTHYSVRFKVTNTIPTTTLQLVYSYSPNNVSPDYIPIQYEAGTSTLRIEYISPSALAVSQAMQAIGTTATVAATAASGAMIVIGGNPAILWALINLIQTFYYLMFINVNYPANVQFFLNIFSLGGFDFIPNPFKWIVSDIQDITLPTPARFEQYNVNGLFLENAGNMLLIWMVVFGVYGVAAFGNKYLNRIKSLVIVLFAKIVVWFEWSGVLRALTTSYPDIAQAAFLQVKVLDFESPVLTASSITGITFAVHSVLFPFIIAFLIWKYVRNKSRSAKKYQTLTEEFTRKGKYPMYFTPILLAKRLLIMATLVFIHDYPYIEIIVLILLSFLTFLLLNKFRPYQTKKDNFVNTTSEFLFIIVHLLIMVLIHDDHATFFSDDDRLDVGWALIGVCGIIVLLNLGATFMEQINMLAETWGTFKKVLEKGKKLPKKRRIDSAHVILNDKPPQTALELSTLSVNNLSYGNSSVSQQHQSVKSNGLERNRRIKRPDPIRTRSLNYYNSFGSTTTLR